MTFSLLGEQVLCYNVEEEFIKIKQGSSKFSLIVGRGWNQVNQTKSRTIFEILVSILFFDPKRQRRKINDNFFLIFPKFLT